MAINVDLASIYQLYLLTFAIRLALFLAGGEVLSSFCGEILCFHCGRCRPMCLCCVARLLVVVALMGKCLDFISCSCCMIVLFVSCLGRWCVLRNFG